MTILITLVSLLVSTTSVSIVEPVDGTTYDGDWLPLRAIVENDNIIPDSVSYILNGLSSTLIARLNTDWLTYMQNDTRNGFSESPPITDANILWTAPVTGFIHIFHSAVVSDGIVYFCHDSLYALDAATGVTIWTFPVVMGDDSPAIYGNRLYLANGDSVFCFDLSVRELLWSSNYGNTDGGSPVYYDGKIFCGVNASGTQGSLTRCLDSDDGSLIWSSYLSGTQGSCSSIWDSILIVPTHTALYGLDIETGDIVWCIQDFEGHHDSSPCIVNGVIYIGGMDSVLRAINAETGEIIWSTPINPVRSIEATPAYCNGIIVSGSKETIFAVDANDGTILWQNDRGLHGSATIAGGNAYWGAYGDLTDPDSIYAADIYTGEVVWSYKPDSLGYPLISTPPIVDGVLYFPASDGNLYAFGTGLKFTYNEDSFIAEVGSNELIVTSWYNGDAVASDTISFTVTQTGIRLEPSGNLGLCARPNPISSFTSISFILDEPGSPSLRIFDLTGRVVSTLIDHEMPAGTHSVQWDGIGDDGQPLSTGLYFCRIECGGVVEITGLCLVR